jgi:hypothetical protein
MNRHVLALCVAAVAAIAPAAAHATIQMTTISPPATIPAPLSGFTVNYTLGGSSVLASAQLMFFLSTTRDGSSGVIELSSQQIPLGRGAGGIFLPPNGTQEKFFGPGSLEPNAVTALQSIAAACQPQSWFIIGRVDFGAVQGLSPSTIGTAKLPDFVFTAGTLSPTTIQPGGTTNFSFSLANQCPAPAQSRVGVFLADSSFNLLATIGFITIGTGAGTFSIPPTGITFSPDIPPGAYTIVLIADVDGFVTESNENNNAGAFSLTVAPPTTTAARGGDAALRTDLELPADFAATEPVLDGVAELQAPR